MKMVRNSVVVLLAFGSLVMAGCGSSNDSGNLALLAASQQAAQQQATAKTNADIVAKVTDPSTGSSPAIQAAASPGPGNIQNVLGMTVLGGPAMEKSVAKRMAKIPESIPPFLSPGLVTGKKVQKNSVMERYSSAGSSPFTTPMAMASSAYSVDSVGRLKKQTTTNMMFGAYSSQYTYVGDTARVDSARFGSNNLTFTYDASGRINGYTLGVFAVTIAYSDAGRVESIGNVVVKFDTHGNLTEISDGTDKGRIVYSYAPGSDNITKRDVFLTLGGAPEVKFAESSATYGIYGEVTSIWNFYYNGSLSNSYEETITYANGEVATRHTVWKDSAGTIQLDGVVTYSNYKKDSEGDMISWIMNGVVNMSDVVQEMSQTWVKLVSGKDNQ